MSTENINEYRMEVPVCEICNQNNFGREILTRTDVSNLGKMFEKLNLTAAKFNPYFKTTIVISFYNS